MSDPAETNSGSPERPHSQSVGTASPAQSGSWPGLAPSGSGSGQPASQESSSPPTAPHTRASFEAGELAMVVSRFDVGVIESVKEFRRGSGRAPKVILKTDRGRFLLKRRTLRNHDLARVKFCHDLQVHLAARKFPLPQLIKTKTDQSTMLSLEQNIYELFEFIPGDSYDQSLDATADAGRALGLFHRLVTSYAHPGFQPTTASYHNAPAAADQLRKAESKLSDPTVAGIVKRLRISYADAARRVEELGFASWPRQVVHGDWHPGNMLFKGNRVAAVIDYDTARMCPRVIDIANGVLQFSITMHGHDPDTWPTALDEGRFKRFCRGYETVRDCVISTAELEALPWLMIEALIIEAVIPIAATGSFAGLSGVSFLRMVDSKAAWLQQHASRLTGLISE